MRRSLVPLLALGSTLTLGGCALLHRGPDMDDGEMSVQTAAGARDTTPLRASQVTVRGSGPMLPARPRGARERWSETFALETKGYPAGRVPIELGAEYGLRTCRTVAAPDHLNIAVTRSETRGTVGTVLGDGAARGIPLPYDPDTLRFSVMGLTCYDGGMAPGVVLERQGRYVRLSTELDRIHIRVDRFTHRETVLDLQPGTLPAGVILMDDQGRHVRLRVLEDGDAGIPSALLDVIPRPIPPKVVTRTRTVHRTVRTRVRTRRHYITRRR